MSVSRVRSASVKVSVSVCKRVMSMWTSVLAGKVMSDINVSVYVTGRECQGSHVRASWKCQGKAENVRSVPLSKGIKSSCNRRPIR